ncbi:hypothetical protein HDZ31DRAFT_34531 [Schizophyllum fasciatum]
MGAHPGCIIEQDLPAFSKARAPLPDLGREPPPFMYHPVDLRPLRVAEYTDQDVVTPVHLRIARAAGANHWWLDWPIGVRHHHHRTRRDDAVTRLQAVQERNHAHLTNWGPLTVIASERSTCAGCAFPLGELTLAQRRKLECIAGVEPVMPPDGEWNCQDWVMSVLRKATHVGVMDVETVNGAVEEALAVPTACRILYHG